MVFDDLPRMVLHDSAVTHNIELMRAFCEASGVSLAPHAKTHMSPELIDRQLAAGAWALTAATTAQVRQLAAFGVPRILQANVLVDSAAIRWVASTFLSAPPTGQRDDAAPQHGSVPDAAGLPPADAPEYLCYVDSLAGLQLLEAELAPLNPVRPLRLLVEVGFTGGRTGTRSAQAGLELGRAVSASPWVELGGVAGFEGLMPLAAGAEPVGARELLRGIRNLTQTLHDEDLFAGEPIVTAGGSSFFDLVVDELGPGAFDFAVRCVLRSGCYITHDHGVYERTSPFGTRALDPDAVFEPALELLASVLSQPEPDLVIVGFGRREAPTDDRLPVLLGALPLASAAAPAAAHLPPLASAETAPAPAAAGPVPPLVAATVAAAQQAAPHSRGDGGEWTVFAVNDHHAFLRVPVGTAVAPGTVLRFGISHPCGAFDRWRSIPLVDADYSPVGVIHPAL